MPPRRGELLTTLVGDAINGSPMAMCYSLNLFQREVPTDE